MFVWKKFIERYNIQLIEKSHVIYEEFLQNELIPEIQRELEGQLTITELAQLIGVITNYHKRIETSSDVSERKQLRSERKYPKEIRKQLIKMTLRKRNYEQHFEILEQ